VPTDDPRLEQALHDAAPSVGTSGVVAQVTQRRTRRRRNRRLGTVALALVALLVVGTVTVAVTRDDHDLSTQVASPGASLRARVVEGGAAVDAGAGTTRTPMQVVLDQDPHLMRAPVLAGSNGLSIASYQPGVEGMTPSYVVRVDGAHVADVVDLKARVLSIAEGEGARWIVTQNHGLTGGSVPDAFLKRVTESGTPPSAQLPPNAEPVGPVAAVGGAVWVPVRDGVLQFDTTGTYARKVVLPAADHRWIAQVGKFAAVTDGRTLHALEVTGPSEVTDTYESPIIGLASAGSDSRVLLDAGAGRAIVRRVTGSTTAGTTGATTKLPEGFLATGLAASPTRIWATGTVDGAPAIALLGDRGVRATVVLENASEGAALAWTDDHTVRAVSDSKLYDIAVP
jgi:hypothetical protein